MNRTWLHEPTACEQKEKGVCRMLCVKSEPETRLLRANSGGNLGRTCKKPGRTWKESSVAWGVGFLRHFCFRLSFFRLLAFPCVLDQHILKSIQHSPKMAQPSAQDANMAPRQANAAARWANIAGCRGGLRPGCCCLFFLGVFFMRLRRNGPPLTVSPFHLHNGLRPN